jgi:hypothetical protein
MIHPVLASGMKFGTFSLSPAKADETKTGDTKTGQANAAAATMPARLRDLKCER